MTHGPSRALAIIFTLALFALGCADDLSAISATEMQFQTAMLREACRARLRCPFWSWSPVSRFEYASEDACVEGMRPYFSDARARSLAVAEGRVRFDLDAANRCLRSVRTICSPIWRDWFRSGACSDVYVGTHGAGESCTVSQECAAGTRCVFSREGCGVCEARALRALGEGCTDSIQCRQVPGAETLCLRANESSSESGVCTARTIEAPAAEGDRCGHAVTSPGHATWTPCVEGTWCSVFVHGGEATCRPYRSEGEWCGDGDPCQASLLCVSNRCTAVEYRRTEGATCDSLRVFCSSVDGLDCVEGRCARVDHGSLGASCALAGARLRCASGLVCGIDNRCVRPGAVGDDCDADDQCASGICDRGRNCCSDLRCGRLK